MNKFGKRSMTNLSTCHPDIVKVAYAVLQEMDIACTCGHRDKDNQNKAYTDKKSQVMWPDSDHNKIPSNAGDFVPWVDGSIPWNDNDKFIEMGMLFLKHAQRMNIRLGWGGFYSSFFDGPHVFRIKENN